MTWLLARITNNPMVIVYIAAACFAAGLAFGALPAWKVQGWRLDAVQARYDSFVAQTRIIGEQASAAAKAKAETDQRNKERFDAEQKKLMAANADLAKRLLDARSGSSYLPAASPGSGSPDRTCFNRAELDGAIRRLDVGVSGVVEKGHAARIGLDTARGWAQGHYRNGREAKNGDKIVKLEGGKVVSFGVLHSATPGNDYCNGNIAVVQPPNDYACMVDCLHIDDVAEMLAEKGMDKRPDGK